MADFLFNLFRWTLCGGAYWFAMLFACYSILEGMNDTLCERCARHPRHFRANMLSLAASVLATNLLGWWGLLAIFLGYPLVFVYQVNRTRGRDPWRKPLPYRTPYQKLSDSPSTNEVKQCPS